MSVHAGPVPRLSQKVGIMAHIAFPTGNDHQGCEALDPVFDALPDARTAADQHARAAQRIAALGEMTGGIAHDFRNILGIIQSGLRLAEQNSREPDKVRTYIAGALDGVDRGLQLTSQLLAFAKQQELDARAGNVNQLLTNLELFLQYGAGPRVRIRLELAQGIPECLIDASQFNAAVLNLVINARDAMPDGGEVRISTARWEANSPGAGSPASGVYVRVRVEDKGQGMPADVLQRIFDPLFTTKGEKGTGLGLPHVCAFMRMIGGYVEVTSDPGVGSTFDLLFPVVQPGLAS